MKRTKCVVPIWLQIFYQMLALRPILWTGCIWPVEFRKFCWQDIDLSMSYILFPICDFTVTLRFKKKESNFSIWLIKCINSSKAFMANMFPSTIKRKHPTQSSTCHCWPWKAEDQNNNTLQQLRSYRPPKRPSRHSRHWRNLASTSCASCARIMGLQTHKHSPFSDVTFGRKSVNAFFGKFRRRHYSGTTPVHQWCLSHTYIYIYNRIVDPIFPTCSVHERRRTIQNDWNWFKHIYPISRFKRRYSEDSQPERPGYSPRSAPTKNAPFAEFVGPKRGRKFKPPHPFKKKSPVSEEGLHDTCMPGEEPTPNCLGPTWWFMSSLSQAAPTTHWPMQSASVFNSAGSAATRATRRSQRPHPWLPVSGTNEIIELF